MKANELRIGNLVTLVGGSDLIHAYKIDVISPLTDEGLDDIKPIPITEEILLKCGFEKKFPFYVKGNIEVRIMGNSMPCWVSSRFVTTKDQHLHQLQNLYFALTGEELNIEL